MDLKENEEGESADRQENRELQEEFPGPRGGKGDGT